MTRAREVRGVALAGVAALCALAGCARQPARQQQEKSGQARRDEGGRTLLPLAELGLDDARRYNTQPTLTFPFFARADRVLTKARLLLHFGDPADAVGVRRIEVLVNQEPIASLGPEVLRSPKRDVVLPIEVKSIGEKNQLTLRLELEQEKGKEKERPCEVVPAGSWKVVASGELELDSAPLPLPDDLALLPLPFIDRRFDREAAVPLVLAPGAPQAELRLAAALAGWLGVDAGVALRFPVTFGALPETSALVLLDGPERAAALGVPALDKPQIRVIDHPRHPGANVKLVLVGGSTPAELEAAVVSLTSESVSRFTGPSALLTPPAPAAQHGLYQAPRWRPPYKPISFDQLASPEQLTHDGTAGGNLTLRFRVAPDLWVWPDEFVVLDLGWTVLVPPGTPQPRLDVVFNDSFLGTLPPVDLAHGESAARTLLDIHRSDLRGFNQLVLHVNYGEAGTCGGPPGPGDEHRVQLAGDSALHLERYGHFASLPDLSTFVDDGFPFTRQADLAETALVLSAQRAPEELSVALSVLAHLGSVTGVVGWPAVLSPEEALAGAGAGKDLLLVGTQASHPLLKLWTSLLPLAVAPGAIKPQMPAGASQLLSLLTGRRGLLELERARAALASTRTLAALEAIESPLTPGRTAVIFTAPTAAELQPFAAFHGYADSRSREGDLLVLAGGKRQLFRIGPLYGLGELTSWDALRWFLASHSLLLVPCLFFGVLLLSVWLRFQLNAKIESRLRDVSAGAPT